MARAAARDAGTFLLRHFRDLDSLAYELKGTRGTDYVTKADRGSEKRIFGRIQSAFPGDGFLGEEGGSRAASRKAGGRKWIVDPLDGTTNFVHSFPQWAVSIALSDTGGLAVGVVFDPVRREMFEAVRGRGARLNGKAIRVSRRRSFRLALVATGFPFKRFTRMPQYLDIFQAVARSTAGIRRPGSASLDLSCVACGRVDAFWEFGLSAWDVAAGALIIQEAGGRVSDLHDGPDFLSGDILASNGALHRPMLDVIRPAMEKRPPPRRKK